MKKTDRTARGLGVILSSLCASLASVFCSVGIVVGCRALRCEDWGASLILFVVILPIAAMSVGAVVAARVAKESVATHWLALTSCLLVLLGFFLAVLLSTPADWGLVIVNSFLLGLFLVPAAGIVTASRFKQRVGTNPPGAP